MASKQKHSPIKAKRGAEVAGDLTFVTALSPEAVGARLDAITDHVQVSQLVAAINAPRFEVTYADVRLTQRFALDQTWIVRFVGTWLPDAGGARIDGWVEENPRVRDTMLHGRPVSVLGSMALGVVIACCVLMINWQNAPLPDAVWVTVAAVCVAVLFFMQTADDRTKRLYRQTLAEQGAGLRDAVYRTLYVTPGTETRANDEDERKTQAHADDRSDARVRHGVDGG
ncbi:MAG: hypothetical protein K8S97_02105 [Anaerolineae bacterium]|nr:hypothetical protein [Anaerolineae bacterium]